MSETLLASAGALSIGGALFFLTTAIGQFLGGRRAGTINRLGQIAGAEIETRQATERRPAGARASGLDRQISGMAMAGPLKRDLRRAGLGWRVSDYVGLIVVTATFSGMLAWAVSGWPVAGLLAALPAGLLPVLLVKRAAGKRAGRLNEQVSDLLDLLASSMRAGFGFTQALELAAREQPDPMSSELQQTLREISLGMSTDEALERMVVRTGDGDVELVITAVLIQRRVGGNLASVLDNISHMIRDRARVRGEIRTLTAQARLSAKIVGFLPIGLAGVVFMMQPDYLMPLVEEPLGRLLLVAAIVLESVGFFLVRRIGAIDY